MYRFPNRNESDTKKRARKQALDRSSASAEGELELLEHVQNIPDRQPGSVSGRVCHFWFPLRLFRFDVRSVVDVLILFVGIVNILGPML